MDSLRGDDEDLGTQLRRLVEESPITADDIAAAVLDGLDRGEELIVPDEPARTAYDAKLHHRAAYDEQMRGIATRMRERA